MKVTYTNAPDELFKKNLVRLEFEGTEEEVLDFADSLDLTPTTEKVKKA